MCADLVSIRAFVFVFLVFVKPCAVWAVRGIRVWGRLARGLPIWGSRVWERLARGLRCEADGLLFSWGRAKKVNYH